MPIKRASQKAKSEHVFGQARKTAKMFRAGLYARVSTNDQQTLAMQSRAMREYAARRGWTIAVNVREVGSGAAQRESREKLLEAARRREIDVVLVWRLDRWGRSVTDLLATLQELEHLGVGFVSLTEALDLTTPAGRAMAALLAVFAEFEREFVLGLLTPARTANAWPVPSRSLSKPIKSANSVVLGSANQKSPGAFTPPYLGAPYPGQENSGIGTWQKHDEIRSGKTASARKSSWMPTGQKNRPWAGTT